MKKNIYILIVASLVLNGTVLFSQNLPGIEWETSLGGTESDGARSIIQTNDGGYIVAGHSSSDDGDVLGHHGSLLISDYWVVKFDANGSVQWMKTLGGSNIDHAYSILQTADGNYLIAGSADSHDGDVSNYYGNTDVWLVNLNSNGDLVWEKTFGGNEYDVAYCIRQTSDSGFVMCATSSSNDYDVTGNHGGSDYWIVKLDQFANVVWQKSFGGSNDEYPRSIQQTTDGGYIVAGESGSNNGDVPGNQGGYDLWVIKIDSTGTMQWQKVLGGSGDDQAYDIIQTSNDGYLLSGYSTSDDGDVSGNHGSYDYWIVKIDLSGNVQWAKTFGGTSLDIASCALEISNKSYIVAGYAASNDGDVSDNHTGNAEYSDFWIINLDTLGNLIWQKTFGGTNGDHAFSINQTTDGGYIVAGDSYSNDGDVSGHHAGYDYWVVKLSSVNGIDNLLSASSFQIYPIPANDYVNIHLELKSLTYADATMSLSNVLGKIVSEKDLQVVNGRLDENILLDKRFLPGLYFLRLNIGEMNWNRPFTIIR